MAARRAAAAAVLPERMAPSMVAGSPVSVQSPASSRLPPSAVAFGRSGRLPGLCRKVARRSLTIRAGGRFAGGAAPSRRSAAATSCQIAAMSSSSGRSSSASAALTVTEASASLGVCAALHIAAQRPVEAKMQVEDRPAADRHGEPGQQLGGDRRRDGQDHLVARRQRDAVAGEIQRRDRTTGALEGPEAAAEADFGARPGERRERRVDQRGRQARGGDVGPAAGSAGAEDLPQDATHQPRRRLLRAGVEDRHGQRLPEAAVEHRAAVEAVGDAVPRPGGEQPQRPQIVGGMAAGHPAGGHGDPPGQPALVRPQQPMLAARQVDEGKDGLRRCRQRRPAAEPVEIGEHRRVGAEDQVVAVVDAAAEGGVLEGAAAAAGMVARLVEAETAAESFRRQRQRRRQAGQPGADDMDMPAGHRWRAGDSEERVKSARSARRSATLPAC